MKQKAFCIYDSKAKSYKTPFFEINPATAIRAVSDVVNDPLHQFHRFASDFVLFEIGEYDLATAVFTSHDQIINHGLLDQWKEKRTSSIADTIGLEQQQ